MTSRLNRKLGTLEPFFSDQERALLLAIFAAAAERTMVSTRRTAGYCHKRQARARHSTWAGTGQSS